MSNDLKVRIRSLIEFVEEYTNEEELTTPNGVRATIDIIEELLNKNEKDLEVLDILKRKHVDLEYFRYACHCEYVLYNKFIIDDKQLTEYEGKRLKEWLKKS